MNEKNIAFEFQSYGLQDAFEEAEFIRSGFRRLVKNQDAFIPVTFHLFPRVGRFRNSEYFEIEKVAFQNINMCLCNYEELNSKNTSK